jgi:hypothetical protein
MQPLSARILELESSIYKLVEANREFRMKLELLTEENQKLQSQIRDFKIREEVNEDHILIKNQNTLNGQITNHIKTKQIINEMMREIDKCLLLLEK